ncbi:hypothetical protein [Gracilibacillus massiliensis]|uniref:hypothetical protein n=1 Tax=Gracilibacillus massiliensis TaxID=1564956 RepID=UPI00071D7695|nr:hypothetical protein [Gracilibacillus massiliensis]
MGSTKSFILRKLSSTVVTTTVFSFLWVMYFIIVDGYQSEYNLGNQLMEGFFFYSIMVGTIILFYGNLVSIIVEKLLEKRFPQHKSLYVLILGVFGLVNGLIIFPPFAYLGMLAAMLYGIIDRWIFKRITKNKIFCIFSDIQQKGVR